MMLFVLFKNSMYVSIFVKKAVATFFVKQLHTLYAFVFSDSCNVQNFCWTIALIMFLWVLSV